MASVPDTHDFSDGVVTTSEDNTYIRDPIRFLLNRPAAVLRQTVAQSIAVSGTWTALTFDTEDLDSDPSGAGGHSTAVNTSRFTAVYPGWYLVGGNAAFAANATGQRGVRFAVNGNAVSGGYAFVNATAANDCSVPATARLVFLNVSDYVELQAFQSSGGALNTFVTGTSQPIFVIMFERN